MECFHQSPVMLVDIVMIIIGLFSMKGQKGILSLKANVGLYCQMIQYWPFHHER
jgi:hypothetical protein